MAERESKQRRNRRNLLEWTKQDAQELAESYREVYDQWEILFQLLDYALLLIKKPSGLPERGFVRLFRDITTEYEGLDISQLKPDQIVRLNRKISRFNTSLQFLRQDSRRLLQENEVTIQKLASLSSERD